MREQDAVSLNIHDHLQIQQLEGRMLDLEVSAKHRELGDDNWIAQEKTLNELNREKERTGKEKSFRAIRWESQGHLV